MVVVEEGGVENDADHKISPMIIPTMVVSARCEQGMDAIDDATISRSRNCFLHSARDEVVLRPF